MTDQHWRDGYTSPEADQAEKEGAVVERQFFEVNDWWSCTTPAFDPHNAPCRHRILDPRPKGVIDDKLKDFFQSLPQEEYDALEGPDKGKIREALKQCPICRLNGGLHKLHCQNRDKPARDK